MATNKLKAKFCETAPPGNHFDGEPIKLSFGSFEKTSLTSRILQVATLQVAQLTFIKIIYSIFL
jgi:hypothetical protein